ncbi:hypothetical protein CJ030_MR3G014725 [Morella rubra]|uniref:DC1 domain-containing protein n=1 Tax=Morella rubra TaxID=262757 RepID=A0A6A1VYI5_9ROSI|nr:hypothetical protein CJ030_MR3G014725 [Morella rubra]
MGGGRPCIRHCVLHPSCLKLPHTVTINEVSLILQKKAPSKCLKCQRKKVSDNIEGWAYVSTCGNYCYHVKCVKELVLEKWREFYFRVPSNDQRNQDTLHLVVEHGSLTGRRPARRIDLSRIKAVLRLIVSAIFGKVVSAVIGDLLLPLL